MLELQAQPHIYLPCSDETSSVNTICYHSSLTADSCPITSINFVKARTKMDNVEVRDWTDEISLIFSKTKGDFPPVTETRIEIDVPCLDANVRREPAEGPFQLEDIETN